MKKLTLTQTIMLIAIVMFSLQLIYGAINSTRVMKMGHHISTIETQYMPITEHITLITEYQLEQEIEFERAFRYALEMKDNDAATDHFMHAVKKFKLLTIKFNKEIKSTEKRILSAAEKMESKENKENKTKLFTLEHNLEIIEKQHEKWDLHVVEVLDLLKVNQFTVAIKKATKVEEEALILEKNVTQILSSIEHLTEEVLHNLKREEESILNIGIVLLIISLVIAVIITRWVINQLNADLSALKEEISRISKGDLVTKVSSKLGTEFGLNTMRQHLNETLLIVENTSNEVLGASDELAKASAEVNQNSKLQAQEFELISTAMTQMESTSLEVARHAESTQNFTKEATSTTYKTKESTNDAMTSILKLTESLKQSSDNISELAKSSENITSVLGVIKGIADQTNLLALNAAIEAARAGEQGRGFAVVADEVRNLAKRTQDSTVEIESMIELFSQGTANAVNSMMDCLTHGKASDLAANESNNKLDEIQTAIEEINDMNSHIATAAEEQSCTSQEISKNTVKASQLTSDNATSIARISAASEELAQISLVLQESLSGFSLN